MTLGIIAAMSEELEILLKDMQLDSSTTKAGMTFNKGKLWNNDVIAVVCGIGKVNAAVCTQILVSEFVADVEKIKWLEKEFNALSCEMEGASIAHVCYLNNIPVVVIRSISDNANNGAHMDFEKFTPIAVKNSTSILKEMLLSLN